METPRSVSPFSAAAPELDDHRFQAHSLPRTNANPAVGPFRSFSQRSADGRARPDLSEMDVGMLRPPAVVVDHEHAIVDDDDDINARLSPFVAEDGPEIRSRPRAGSGIANSTSHRRHHSRASSRSPSPPNSVDAFANPEHRRRMERSGTISSQAPTDLALGLRRTISRRTISRCQTFTDEGECINSDDGASQKPEEDVCFPPPEETQIRGGIDFEEIEEFVAKQNEEREPRSYEQRRKTSSSSLRDSRYFADSPKKSSMDEPIRQDFAKGPECVVDDSGSIMNEKGGKQVLPDTAQKRISNPDRFNFFSSELDATIHASEIGDLLIEGETFRDLFRGGQGVWWLDCLNPTHEELSMLMKAFAIHPLTAEDIRVQETREKVELFRSYYFVCFRSFVLNKKSHDFMEPVNVYIIVFREGVLSFHFTPSPHSANVRRRIRQLRDYVAISSDWICYALIDDITDSFGPVIRDIEQETDAIEDAVFYARTDDLTNMLRQIGECRKKCMGLMRLLGGKADVIKSFAKRCNEQYQVTPRGEIGLYLGDIQDHVVTMMSSLSHFEKMLSRSHSNYIAQLSVDSMASANRANNALGKITTLATILVPLNFVCGIFGMNVHVPGAGGTTLNWFFGIMGFFVFFTLVSLWLSRRSKLI
ncbi:hypothetical protein RUND412_008699 [Rhizina undulata]